MKSQDSLSVVSLMDENGNRISVLAFERLKDKSYGNG